MKKLRHNVIIYMYILSKQTYPQRKKKIPEPREYGPKISIQFS